VGEDGGEERVCDLDESGGLGARTKWVKWTVSRSLSSHRPHPRPPNPNA